MCFSCPGLILVGGVELDALLLEGLVHVRHIREVVPEATNPELALRSLN